MAGGLKFRIKVVEGMFYTCSENKGADQLRGADLRLVFAYAKSWFSHDKAHFNEKSISMYKTYPFFTLSQFTLLSQGTTATICLPILK